MIPSRAITLHIYSALLPGLEHCLKRSSPNFSLSARTQTRWINEAIAQKLDKPPEMAGEVLNARKPSLSMLVYAPADLVDAMTRAARVAGMSRNKWVNAAIRARLGMVEGDAPAEKPVHTVRIQLGIYISNAHRIDDRVRLEGTTRTAWINAAIRERVERDKDLPPAVAPVTRAIPKVSTPAQIEAAERKAKIEAIRAQRLAEAAKEAEQLEQVPTAKLAEDGEIDFWG